MTAEEKYKLSAYKEITLLSENEHKRIYIVQDEVTNRLFIKKILFGLDNFTFYKRMTSLEHKNIAKVYDVIQGDGNISVIEEYVNGKTLRAILENEGVQSENKVIAYIIQVCDALIYLHRQSPPVIHRDIKPENIICLDDGSIKLIDFDIAREYKKNTKRDTIFMGTNGYAAPEQYGYRQTDCRTDIFAVGVLIHELATGRITENNITYKGKLRRIINKCLCLDPEKRYQNAADLKKALELRLPKYRVGIPVLASVFLIFLICLLIFVKIHIFGGDWEYEGELLNGEAHGYGTCTWQNGDKYEGEWKNDIMDGYGIYTWANGNKYEGYWKNGVKEGKGTETNINGIKYEGDWKNDVPDGYGIYEYGDGEKYEGEWKNNKMSGHGTYTWADGSSLVGNWENDLLQGEAVYTDVNGDVWYEVYEKGEIINSTKDKK